MPKGIPRNSSTKAQALKRLKVARGHLNKVIQMVEDDDYCIDVVHQSIAVSAALKKTNELILENHLKTCVFNSMKTGEEHTVIEEVIAVLKKS